ncbi:S-layer homology domain-containing protein [Lysinibacillus capsici]|uniref:S-layer homology domain-containing protein n=1 Tax=Lysinibacillus capsici TaxID=2115968 RepID=UPI002A821048|nr:S-layer homology domain-containing protein [Lysinibacillus capsici]
MAKQNKGRKFFAASATAALVASAIVPVASAAQVNDYNKISGYAKEAVQSLVDAGVIQGDTNGNFNPLNTVTRAQAAEIFTKALELEADGDVNFSDVKKGAWYYNSIAAVVANGIFEGVSANEFAPNKSLTRSEAAKVLVDAFGLEGSESLSQFADASQVKPWAKDALETAVANGIFTGSEENGKLNLKPNAAITRQDFAVVFARTLDLAVETVDASVKAINATTVEVTFEEEVDADNLKASDFKIEGLEITNAAVKQTNKKVVVLTTATQTADKEYVLTKNGEEIGKFKGISAVIPTAIKLTTPSVQGTIGKQATVSAEVTVPEGQSKAGIPVTFNIVSDTNSNLNEKVEVVAYTDEKGVASYSYTRYYKHNDSVTAYATDKSTVYASGKVYWAEGLTITEVTTGNELANGAKKVYKIKTDLSLTETNGTSATTDDYKYVNVAFLENVDVTPDKLVRDVEVIDTGVASTSTYTQAKYPSQVTTGGIQTVRVKVNADGEATFTLTGSNATVTPIVFVDNTSNTTGKYTKTALQASAPAVKFALSHTLGLTVKAEGEQNAASIATGYSATSTTNVGGREYVATFTDKDGKVAPADTTVYVTFEDGNVSKNNVTVLVTDKDGNVTATTAAVGARIPVKVVGSKGEAKFRVVGQKDAFAKPTVYYENGSDNSKLDKNDLQTVGEMTYFVNAKVANATIKVKNPTTGKEVTTLPNNQVAVFEYQSVDQNGFSYFANSGNYEVSYEVKAQFADVKLFADQAKTIPVNYTNAAGDSTNIVKAGTTATVKVNAVAGLAKLYVSSEDVSSNVTVNASASLVSLPNKDVSVSFVSSNVLPDIHTGFVTGLNENNSTIKLDTYNAVSYVDAKFFDASNNSNIEINETQFLTLVKGVTSAQKAQVSAVKQSNGTYVFTFRGAVAKSAAEQLADAITAYNVVRNAAISKKAADYTPVSYAALQAALTANALNGSETAAQVDAKKVAIQGAIDNLVTVSEDNAARQAALAELATAKAKAEEKKEADYTTASWSAFKTKLDTTIPAMPQDTVNQINAKAQAYKDAVTALVAKTLIGNITATVDSTAATLQAGKLVITFTEANSLAGFDVDLYSTVSGAATGTLATVADTDTAEGTLTVTLDPTGVYDLTQAGNQGATYTFTATAVGTDAMAKDIKVTVKFENGAWTATVQNN